MKCSKCNGEMKLVNVAVDGATNKVISYQCTKCDYFEFEPKSSSKVLKELKSKESPLKLKQKIIKLSQGRLGIYFNQNIVRSLDLRPGEEIYVSIPDKKHIILNIE